METTVLAQAEDYVIQRRTDTRLDAEYLVLYGTLSGGNLVLMRSALGIRKTPRRRTSSCCIGSWRLR